MPGDPTPPTWAAVLRQQIAMHPSLHAQDLRKLVHQAICGPGHAIPSAAAALDRLRHEVATMGSGPPHPLVEPIAPHAGMVRVHLRPWVAAGQPLEPLCAGFVASADECRAGALALPTMLPEVTAALAIVAPTLLAGWQTELAPWADAGYPAVHHSPAFERAERPAYRVLTAAQARIAVITRNDPPV